MNKFIQAVISGFVFLVVWLLFAGIFGESITDTFWLALVSAIVFGIGIYFFSDRRSTSASTDSEKKI